jgi:hypothetical protein
VSSNHVWTVVEVISSSRRLRIFIQISAGEFNVPPAFSLLVPKRFYLIYYSRKFGLAQ